MSVIGAMSLISFFGVSFAVLMGMLILMLVMDVSSQALVMFVLLGIQAIASFIIAYFTDDCLYRFTFILWKKVEKKLGVLALLSMYYAMTFAFGLMYVPYALGDSITNPPTIQGYALVTLIASIVYWAGNDHTAPIIRGPISRIFRWLEWQNRIKEIEADDCDYSYRLQEVPEDNSRVILEDDGELKEETPPEDESWIYFEFNT